MSKSAVRTEAAPAPFQGAPYNQAIVANGFVFVSGQGPLDPSGKLVEGDIAVATHQTFDNLQAILEAAGSSLDKVVKASVFLADLGEFGGHERGLQGADAGAAPGPHHDPGGEAARRHLGRDRRHRTV